MRILFIVTSYWAFGELTIALQFAKGLTEGNDIMFLAPRNQEKIIKANGFKSVGLYFKLPSINRALLADIASSYSPDFVILSDYLNYSFCDIHYGLKLEDLECFRGKIGAFDLYDIGRKVRTMDTYGFNNKKVAFDHERVTFRLLPCPILSPSCNSPAENVYAAALDTDYHIQTPEEKQAAKQELGYVSKKKLILTTSALWQDTYKSYDNVVEFVKNSEAAYQQIISALVQDNYVVCVGNNEQRLEGVTYIDSLPPQSFKKYCEAADLFISRNMISTSFANIVMSGVKGVLLQNSRSEGKTVYPYRMYPVGWYHFLEPIIKDNDYMNLFQTGEIFDVEASIELISNALDSMIDTLKLQDYHRQLKELPRGDAILRSL